MAKILNGVDTDGDEKMIHVDEVATAAAKWHMGDIVARSYAWIADVHYRRFLGVTEDGGYLVQDFYENTSHGSGICTSDPSDCGVCADLPFTAPYILYSEQEVLNGNADIYQLRSISGNYTSWYDNGQKRQHTFFVEGKPQGMWEMWHANGQKSQEGQYLDGIPNGLWTQWYDNGNKLSEIEYADGMEHGCHREWFRNGKKCVQGQSEKGKAVEQWTWWDDEGNVEREINYSNI